MAILKNQIYSVNMSSFSSKFFCGAVRARPNKLLICHKSWHLLRFFKQGQTESRVEPTCYFCTGKTWLSFSLEKIVKQSSKENRKRKQIILVTTKHKKIRSFLYILALFRKKRFEINFLFLRNASKFAIFIEKENPHSFFVFHFEHFWVLPYECPGLCQHRPGHL